MPHSSSNPSPHSDEKLQMSLKRILEEFEVPGVSAKHTRELARRMVEIAVADPLEFFLAAVSLLLSEGTSPGWRHLGALLAGSPGFIVKLTDPRHFSRTQMVELCKRLMETDPLLDVRLAHQLPGYHNDGPELKPEVVVAVLDILDQISPRERLVLVLTHLTRHKDPRIASRAALLLGRRVSNPRWVECHLADPDDRLRANVVEGLWGVDSWSAREALEECLRDGNNRVVGNALVGLQRLGDPKVPESLKRMLQDKRPGFRSTAAWAMGTIGALEFEAPLKAALDDADEGVRKSVRRALEALQRSRREPVPIDRLQNAPEAPPNAEQHPISSQSVRVV
jgi:hypothetical protein